MSSIIPGATELGLAAFARLRPTAIVFTLIQTSALSVMLGILHWSGHIEPFSWLSFSSGIGVVASAVIIMSCLSSANVEKVCSTYTNKCRFEEALLAMTDDISANAKLNAEQKQELIALYLNLLLEKFPLPEALDEHLSGLAAPGKVELKKAALAKLGELATDFQKELGQPGKVLGSNQTWRLHMATLKIEALMNKLWPEGDQSN